KAVPNLVKIRMKIPVSVAQEKLGIPEPEDNKTPILQSAQTAPHLAANTYQPQLLNQFLAANQAQIPLEDQALQLLLNEQTQQS
ncbi:DUF935 domain-containing protein, partial [Acinetobacter baumannii]